MSKTQGRLYLLNTVITAIMFLAVFHLPPRAASGIPFVAVALLCIWLPRDHFSLVFASACIALLSIVGYWEQLGAGNWNFATEQGLAVFAVGVTAILALRYRKARRTSAYSERLYRLVALTTDCIVVCLDTELRVLEWNSAAEEIYGLARRRARGKDYIRLCVQPERRKPIRNALRRALKGETVGVIEDMIRTRNETELPVLWTISTIIDDDGKPFGIAAIGQDITARKKLETSLIEASETAVAASRAKSEFLANTSHELRTPMTGILSMSELLLDTHLDPDQREYLDIVHSSAQGLMTILNDILDYSKIEAGRLTTHLAVFELGATVKGLIDLMRPAAEAKGLELEMSFGDDGAYSVTSDEHRIRQVLTNLLGNAVKFTEQGSVKVRLTREHAEGSPHIRVQVEDTGIGIPVEFQEGIFEQFTQVDSSSTRKHGGTGLGLTISRRLVELLEGEIGFTSTPGEGSIFWLTIPVSPYEALTSGDQQSLDETTVLTG